MKEQMENEGRAPITPQGCSQIGRFATVWMECGAGEQSGHADGDYRAAGTRVLPIRELTSLFSHSDTVIIKVKQPVAADYVWLKHVKDCAVMAYFHSTGEEKKDTLEILLKNNITAMSYENITENDGHRPLLTPMSKIAGWRGVEIGIELLHRSRKSYALSPKADGHLQMVIIGGGKVGVSAVEEGLRKKFSRIVVFEENPLREQFLERHFCEEKSVFVFSPANAVYDLAKKREIEAADILIGAVLVPGGHSPTAVTLAEVESMGKGSVVVDVSIDQGGCIERPKEGKGSTFDYRGITFCCIPNLPGSVPQKSTPAFAGALLPFIIEIARAGVETALQKSAVLRSGLLTYASRVTNRQAAEYWNEPYADPRMLLLERMLLAERVGA